MLVASLALTVAACGDDDGGGADAHVHMHDGAANGADASGNADAANNPADAALIDGSSGAFVLTSTSYMEGQFIPIKHTCQGANVSPPLAWTGAPSGTMAYALIFTDLDNGPSGFLHSIMWDIPVATTSLPEGVENAYEPSVPAGAKQTRGYNGSTRGYLGPCPGSQHTYEMRLHAVNIATLPGLGTSTNMPTAKAAIENASLGSATLTGEFNPN